MLDVQKEELLSSLSRETALGEERKAFLEKAIRRTESKSTLDAIAVFLLNVAKVRQELYQEYIVKAVKAYEEEVKSFVKSFENKERISDDSVLKTLLGQLE
ncbi:MAG: hypothetical protein ACK4NC_02130 [Candidatus Gracilibacteria bacterium]